MNYNTSLSLGSFTLIIPNIHTQILQTGVDVAVNFLPLVIFVFLLFLIMVIYASEVETKEKYKLPEIKNQLLYVHFLHLISFHNHFFLLCIDVMKKFYFGHSWDLKG